MGKRLTMGVGLVLMVCTTTVAAVPPPSPRSFRGLGPNPDGSMGAFPTAIARDGSILAVHHSGSELTGPGVSYWIRPHANNQNDSGIQAVDYHAYAWTVAGSLKDGVAFAGGATHHHPLGLGTWSMNPFGSLHVVQSDPVYTYVENLQCSTTVSNVVTKAFYGNADRIASSQPGVPVDPYEFMWVGSAGDGGCFSPSASSFATHPGAAVAICGGAGGVAAHTVLSVENHIQLPAAGTFGLLGCSRDGSWVLGYFRPSYDPCVDWPTLRYRDPRRNASSPSGRGVGLRNHPRVRGAVVAEYNGVHPSDRQIVWLELPDDVNDEAIIIPEAISDDGRGIVGHLKPQFGPDYAWVSAVPSGSYIFDQGGNRVVGSAMAITAGAEMVVGEWVGVGAFVYRLGHGNIVEVLIDDLRTAGVDIPQGWYLRAATVMSSDGRTIAGTGYNHLGQSEAWIVYPDCDQDGVPDAYEIANGLAQDCNGNTVPDACEIDLGLAPDCNANGIPDECDIAAGTSQDCNRNGIPDECEIAADPSLDCNQNGTLDSCECLMDLVVVVDTSGSMGGVNAALCEALEGVIQTLRLEMADIRAEVYMIAPGGSVGVGCAVGTVTQSFATIVPGSAAVLGSPIHVGACGQFGDPTEDWGAAVAVLAEEYPWRPGSGRIIVPISDEGPRCGDGIDTGTHAGSDELIIELAINAVVARSRRASPMRVYPISPNGTPQDIVALANLLATATRGENLVLSSVDVEIMEQEIAALLLTAIRRACPTDCQLNGIPDVCESPRPGCSCWADIDGNGEVNTADISAFLSLWFADRANGTLFADFNEDGVVDTSDITAFNSQWFHDRANGCDGAAQQNTASVHR